MPIIFQVDASLFTNAIVPTNENAKRACNIFLIIYYLIYTKYMITSLILLCKINKKFL